MPSVPPSNSLSNAPASNTILSVTELNRAVREQLETGFPLQWIRGEVSNCKRAPSGHLYFSLKDHDAQVDCVMFRGRAAYLDAPLANGMQVEVRALVTLYEPRGSFQLNVEAIRRAGVGSLFEAFAQLKQKLQEEGLFDVARKRAIPAFPRAIGIVTSPQAAALRDVLTTLRRRHPGIPVVIYPAPVQGEGAGSKIAAAIAMANTANQCDVLLLVRGGGSIEDLWAFNEEVVARAIAGSRLPVVSGIGHETDFTIADFVADLRAATPTAAAEHASPKRDDLLATLTAISRTLTRAWGQQRDRLLQRLDYASRRLVHPREAQLRRRQHLDALAHRLIQAADTLAHRRNERLRTLAGALTHLSPHAVLERGYSVVRDSQGRVITHSKDVSTGDALDVTFAAGGALVRVERPH